MFKFSEGSINKLMEVHPDLVKVANAAPDIRMTYHLTFDNMPVDSFYAEDEAQALEYVKEYAEMRGMAHYEFKWRTK